MRKSIIWELVKINILYASAKTTNSFRQKQKKQKKKSSPAYKKAIGQQLFALIIFLVIYSSVFINNNYKTNSSMFSFQLFLFVLLSTLFGFSIYFTTFFDSKDIKLYLSLPIHKNEFFLGKLLSVQGAVLTFLLPSFTLLCLSYYQIGGVLATVWAIPNFLILWTFVNAINLLILYFIGGVLKRSKHKTFISKALIIITSLLAIGCLFFIQNTQFTNVLNNSSFIEIPVLIGFHTFISDPFSIKTLIHFGGLLLGLLIALYFIFKKVIPNYFEQALQIEENKMPKKVRTKTNPKMNTSLRQMMIKHHLSTLANGPLIVQTFLQSLIYLFSFLPGFFAGYSTKGGNIFLSSLSILGAEFFGAALVIGFLIGTSFSGETTFISVAISLERENYRFLKSLPFNFKQFLIQKFWVVSGAQFIVPIIMYTAVVVFLKFNRILIIFFVIGMILSSLLFGQYYYARDNRFLKLHWQNINHLFFRSGGQWRIVLRFFLTLILGGIILSTIIYLSIINPIPTNIIAFSSIIILTILAQVYFFKTFWNKL